jgi:MFS family permease
MGRSSGSGQVTGDVRRKYVMPKVSRILIGIWAAGFGASIAMIVLTEIIPNGGWPGGILFYLSLLFFFPANLIGMAILKHFWDPYYMTPEGMPVMFWILAVCINWIVLLLPIYLILMLLKHRPTKTTNHTDAIQNK